MDSLADAVAGLEEARVTCHFQQLITRLAQLQKDVDVDELKWKNHHLRRQACYLHHHALVPVRLLTSHNLQLWQTLHILVPGCLPTSHNLRPYWTFPTEVLVVGLSPAMNTQ